MKRIKARFEEDPIFATSLIIAATYAAAMLLKSTAKLVESSAYAYRASKI